MKKHSVSIRGHRTSFSLEEEFWLEIKSIAAAKNISIAQLITQVDTRRDETENLSSALRLHVLHTLKSAIE